MATIDTYLSSIASIDAYPQTIATIDTWSINHRYHRHCPHTHHNLSRCTLHTSPKEHILCCAHGAIFNKEDGMCIDGPCEGQSLMPLAVSIEPAAATAAEVAVGESCVAANGTAEGGADGSDGGGSGICNVGYSGNGSGGGGGVTVDGHVVVLAEQALPLEMTIPRKIQIPPPSKRRLKRLQKQKRQHKQQEKEIVPKYSK